MSIQGFSLIPAQDVTEKILAFREEIKKEIIIPEVDPNSIEIHTPIIKSYFTDDIDPAKCTETARFPIRMRVGEIYVQSPNVVFIPILSEDATVRMQRHLIDAAINFIDKEKIKTLENPGMTEKSKELFNQYGYCFVGHDYRPHISLGEIKPGYEFLSKHLVNDFSELLAGKLINFEKIVFCEYGDKGEITKVLYSTDM